MNRIDWLMWGFRLLIGIRNLEGVKSMVADLAKSDLTGPDKRKLVEEYWAETIKASLPAALQAIGVYLLRSLVELVLARLTGDKS